MSDWLFGYGSLLWRPEFPFLEQRPARLYGWVRRFWQGSHDHRGVPEAPGRVVTLIADAAGYTDGLAFRLPADGRAQLLAALDHREKNGYERRVAPVHFAAAVADAAKTLNHSVTCDLSAPAAESGRSAVRSSHSPCAFPSSGHPASRDPTTHSVAARTAAQRASRRSCSPRRATAEQPPATACGRVN